MRGAGAFARTARSAAARGRRSGKALSLERPSPPGWVLDWLGDVPARALAARAGVALQIRESGTCCFVRATVAGARALGAGELRLAVERAYHALAECLAERGLVPLRMWNYVPEIRSRAAGDLSRYEVFNMGRHRAVSEWLAAPRLDGRLPAASAIDHHGPDLEVHVLAGPEPGIAIENPRQIPAWRYSARYGPRPPCFARALRVAAPRGGEAVVLVSGTASIVGEDSRHAGDLAAQLDETFANLAALAGAFAPDGASDRAAALARYRALRVYVVRQQDAREVARRVRRALPAAGVLELFRADLCRPELLVEIEGLAAASPAGAEGAPGA